MNTILHSLNNFTYVMYITELPDDLMERIEQMSNRMNELNDLRAKVRVNFDLQHHFQQSHHNYFNALLTIRL